MRYFRQKVLHFLPDAELGSQECQATFSALIFLLQQKCLWWLMVHGHILKLTLYRLSNLCVSAERISPSCPLFSLSILMLLTLNILLIRQFTFTCLYMLWVNQWTETNRLTLDDKLESHNMNWHLKRRVNGIFL